MAYYSLKEIMHLIYLYCPKEGGQYKPYISGGKYRTGSVLGSSCIITNAGESNYINTSGNDLHTGAGCEQFKLEAPQVIGQR